MLAVPTLSIVLLGWMSTGPAPAQELMLAEHHVEAEVHPLARPAGLQLDVAASLAGERSDGAPPPIQQTGTIVGEVQDQRTLAPVTSAQVHVPGLDLGTLTGSDGAYVLTDVPVGTHEVRVERIGFRSTTQEVVVRENATTVADFRLSQEVLRLDEIVVTGTAGGIERRAIGNAVSTVDVADAASVMPVPDIQQVLSARVPGVRIMAGQGNVGTGGVTRVRGVGTASLSAEPLIYVDGVRVDNDPAAGPNLRGGAAVSRINDINPADIESIEVIKGPAAATLYGTEAANGVIQIITKRGVSGTPQFDFTLRQGANWLPSPEEVYPAVYSRDPNTGEILRNHVLETEHAAGRDVFRTGHTQGVNVGVRGGTDAFMYYVSADVTDDEGIVPWNWRRRFNSQVNLTLAPRSDLDFDTNLGFVRGQTRFAGPSGLGGYDIGRNIFWSLYDRKDDPRLRGFGLAPPEAIATIETQEDIDRIIGNVRINHRPWGWLNQRLVVGADIGNSKNSTLFPRHPEGSNYFFGVHSLGRREVDQRKVLMTTVDYSATASLDVTADLSSSTSVGAQHYGKRIEMVDALGLEFPAPGVETVGGAAVSFADEDIIENKTFGLYLQQQIGWKNRLFITGAIRGDDNSAFGENFEIVTYPKVSATWVIHEEPFFNVPFVDELRLRAAWGRAGQQPDVFAAVRLYSPVTGPGDASVMTPETIGNPDLKPEVGEELEAGFDASVLGDRVALELTYYRQRTKDAILARSVSPSSGFPGSQFVNLGEVSNQGVELGVNAWLIDGDRLGWSLYGTVSTNENRVEDLGGLPPITFGQQQHREGYPLAGYWARRVVSAEFDENGDVTNMLCASGPDGDGTPVQCEDAGPVYWGSTIPKWEGSIGSELTYGPLRLVALVDFVGSHLLESGDIGAAHVIFRNSRAINERRDPILFAYDRLGMWQTTGVLDAGFAKLRELSASYELPSSLVARIGASRGSVTVAGRNIATLWLAQEEAFGRRQIDPEVRSTSNQLTAYNQAKLPQFTQLRTTLRLRF